MAETKEKDYKGPLDRAAEIPDAIGLLTPAVKEEKSGALTIDRTKVTPQFDFGEVFTDKNIDTIEKQFGSKINQLDQFSINNKDELRKVMNGLVTPQYLYFENPNIQPLDISMHVDAWNRSRIDALRKKEMTKEVPLAEQFDIVTRDVKPVPSDASYSVIGNTKATRAKKFLEYLDKTDINPIDKVKLLNRQVLGTPEENQKLFNQIGLGDAYRKFTNVAEKSTLRVAELPRTVIDLFGTVFGYATEYGYAGVKALADVTNIADYDTLPKYDQGGNLVSRGFFQDMLLMNEDARDKFRQAIGPDAVENYQRLLAQDGIVLTKGQARDIMNFNFTATGRFFEHAPTLLTEVVSLLALEKKAVDKTFKELKKYEALNPNKTKPEILNGFVAEKMVSVNFLKKTREKMLSSRIKKGMDIEEFKKPIEERVIYQEAKKAVDIAEKDYLDTVSKNLPKNQTIIDESDFSTVLEVKKKRAILEQKKIELFHAQNQGNTPQWIKETYRDTGMFAGMVALSGQYMQNLGVDQDFSYLAGGIGTIAFGLGSTFFTGGRIVDGYLNLVNPDTSKFLYKYLDEVEGMGFENKEEVMAFLRNPALDNLSGKTRKLATKLAKTINTVSDEFRPQLLANIEYYFDLKKRLMDKGIDPSNISEGLGGITGVAYFTAIEDSFISSIDYTSILDKNTMKTFLKIQDKRQQLHANLQNVYEQIFKAGEYDPNDPDLAKLNEAVTGALSDLKNRHYQNSTLMESFLQHKMSVIKSVLDGNATVDVLKLVGTPAKLDKAYKELLSDAELMLADKLKEQNLGRLNIKDDVQSAENLVNNIKAMQKSMSKRLGENLSVYDDQIRDDLFNIQDMKEVTLKGPQTTETNVKNVVLKEYVDENATLARMALLAKTNRGTEARIPLIQFDAKYRNLRTDATDFIFGFLDEASNIPRGTKQLVSMDLPKIVGGKLDSIFNIRAKEVIERNNIDVQDLLEAMRAKGYDTSNVRHIDMIKYLREEDGLDIGIGLTMEDTSNLYDFFSLKAAKAPAKGKIPFATYRDRVEKELFENIINVDGTKLDEGSEIFKELKTLKDLYFTKKISVFDNPKKTSYTWANPTRVGGGADNATNPGGMEWSKGNTPDTWLTSDDLIKGNKIDDFNTTIVEMFGDVVPSTNGTYNYIINKSNPNYKNLQLIAKIKYAKGIKELQARNLGELEMKEATEKLATNIENAFRIQKRQKGELAEQTTESIFDAKEAQEDMFQVSARAKHNKEIAKVHFKTLDEIEANAKSQEQVIKGQIRLQRERMDTLLREKNFATNKQFVDRFFRTSDGPTLLTEYRDEVVKSGKMTADQFNLAAKDIYSRHVRSMFSKKTGRKRPIIDKDGKSFQVMDEVDTDFDELNKFLNDDELVSGMIRSGFFDKDHIKNLKLVNEVLARQRKRDIASAKFTGQPTGLSIESYISRFYAVNRNVVSARYVGTESIIQALRMNNHRLLEEMFLNKDVAEAMADIIVKNQKLPEARAVQINNILKAIAIKSTVEYRETEREELAAEKLRFDLPKKQQSLAGDMQQNLMGRDKYSPPQFMPFN
tara:strand:- start:136 stop:4821 length:4686 start_codon:yes stop_codon:yes gene_type:complete